MFVAMIIIISINLLLKFQERDFCKNLCALALFPVRVFTFRGHSRLVGVQDL
jgi:hypothetical protein